MLIKSVKTETRPSGGKESAIHKAFVDYAAGMGTGADHVLGEISSYCVLLSGEVTKRSETDYTVTLSLKDVRDSFPIYSEDLNGSGGFWVRGREHFRSNYRHRIGILPTARMVKAARGGRNLTKEAIDRNVAALRKGLAKPAFPEIRDLFDGVDLMTSFSHLNPNLRAEEVFGNHVLAEIAHETGASVLNTVYDQAAPRSDSPDGTKLQFGHASPKIIRDGGVLYSLQTEGLQKFDEAALRERLLGSNVSRRDLFEERLSELLDRVGRNTNGESAHSSLLRMRRDMLGLVLPDSLPEVPASGLAEKCAEALEILDHMYGKLFWEMPNGHANERRAFVRFVDNGETVDPLFDGQNFTLKCGVETVDGNGRYHFSDKVIAKEDIYKAIKRREVILDVEPLVLATVTAPQIPHMGGGELDWERYAPPLVERQCRWLGTSDGNLVLGTGANEIHRVVLQDSAMVGFFLNYLHFGRGLNRILREGKFKQVSYGMIHV